MTLAEYLCVAAMKECDEVSQRISKAIRFGFQEVQRGQEFSNRERIRLKFVDLVATLDLIDPSLTSARADEIAEKKEKIDHCMRDLAEQGLLSTSTADAAVRRKLKTRAVLKGE
jgi:hypothetical protein